MNPRERGSSSIQWINRKDMSARTEDGVSLCQRALQIITELCLAGHVDREKCADIFPTESNIPDISVSLLAVLVGFCGLALLVVSLFVFWKLCWPIWRSKALSTHNETVPQGVLPEAPAPTPHVTPSLPERQALQAEKQEKKEEDEDQRRKVPEVKLVMAAFAIFTPRLTGLQQAPYLLPLAL
ncbi:hypothetical protein QTP86_008312 [Hemibagrus guttatus]|nr:hypothetical protein QTP86_008312 [Hemibagrus guttatus]